MKLKLSIFFILASVFCFGVFACSAKTSSAVNEPEKQNTSPVAEPTPEKATKLPVAQNVTVISADKLPLAGTLFESSNPKSSAVLLLHQFGSDRHAYDAFAKRLQIKGFNVLSIDGRGFGESVKTADGKTIGPSRTDESVKAMNGDVAAAFEFLAIQKNVDPTRVGIIGASYGSSLAIFYAAENTKVAAVALLSPGLNYFGNMPTEPAIKKYGDRPLYLLAATDDNESVRAVEKLNPIVGGKAKYDQTIHPSGGHGTALLKVGAIEELEVFFSKRLGLVK